MKEINQYIRKQTRELRKKTTVHNKLKDNSLVLQKIKDDYNQWIYDLKQLMSNGLSRQVLKDIEEKKIKFELLKNELWRYRIIKAKAILKIIKIKMNRHSNEIILENSSQNRALKFWFNQIFITLEELILEFRYDINEHMDYKSKKIIEPVQTIIEYHLEYIYYLCVFSIKINEVIPLISYLSITSKFIPYIPFMSKPKLLSLFQNIILFKVKLYIENCNFISALENIKIVLKLCFREMHLYMNYDTKIYIKSLYNMKDKNKTSNKDIFGFCRIIKKIVLAYFLRGVTCEHLGYFIDSIKSYKECRLYSNKFLFDYNKEIFKFFRNLERKYIFYKEIFEDIHNHFSNKNKNEKPNTKKIILNKKYINSLNRNNRYKGSFTTFSSNKSRFKSAIRLSSKSINSPVKRQKLESLLKNIGVSLYKEEENRNNNIFKKFTKNTFALSTVKMINNLLSDQFNHVLKKMDKVEITKPQDDINHLINWTIYFQRQKEFKNYLIKSNQNYKKRGNRNNSCMSCREFKNIDAQKLFKTKDKDKDPIKILQKSNIFKNENIKIEKINRKISKSQTTKNKIVSFGNIFKFKFKQPILLSSSKTNQNTKRNNQKILKFPLNKDVFSKSLLNKKNYLDSFYEKELNFQKKLLKLRGYDTEKVSTEFNQQKVINSAEQDFKIIRCFAESKNTKKNLINLVKSTNDEHALEIMFPDKKLRNRSNRLIDLKNLKNYMLINNISLVKERYQPNNVKQYNEEKSKMLNMECAKLEELQNKYQTKRRILMNKGIKKKRIEEYNYY